MKIQPVIPIHVLIKDCRQHYDKVVSEESDD